MGCGCILQNPLQRSELWPLHALVLMEGHFTTGRTLIQISSSSLSVSLSLPLPLSVSLCVCVYVSLPTYAGKQQSSKKLCAWASPPSFTATRTLSWSTSFLQFGGRVMLHRPACLFTRGGGLLASGMSRMQGQIRLHPGSMHG